MNQAKVNEIKQKYIDGISTTRTKKIYYQNQIGVRKSGIEYAMNYLELSEYSKCYHDEVYFIEHYLGVKLYDFQKEMVDHFRNNRFQIFLSSRQTGTERLLMMLFLHTLIFNTNKTIFMFDYVSCNNLKNLNILKDCYIKLPFFIQVGVIGWNKKGIFLENGSRFYISPYTKYAAISHSMDLVFMNNFSKYKHIESFYKYLYPSISSINNSKIIIKSHISGHDFFYGLLQNSERTLGDPKKNVFKTYRTYWWQIPERDITWKNNEIKKCGQYIFDTEYDFTFTFKSK